MRSAFEKSNSKKVNQIQDKLVGISDQLGVLQENRKKIESGSMFSASDIIKYSKDYAAMESQRDINRSQTRQASQPIPLAERSYSTQGNNIVMTSTATGASKIVGGSGGQWVQPEIFTKQNTFVTPIENEQKYYNRAPASQLNKNKTPVEDSISSIFQSAGGRGNFLKQMVIMKEANTSQLQSQAGAEELGRQGYKLDIIETQLPRMFKSTSAKGNRLTEKSTVGEWNDYNNSSTLYENIRQDYLKRVATYNILAEKSEKNAVSAFILNKESQKFNPSIKSNRPDNNPNGTFKPFIIQNSQTGKVLFLISGQELDTFFLTAGKEQIGTSITGEPIYRTKSLGEWRDFTITTTSEGEQGQKHGLKGIIKPAGDWFKDNKTSLQTKEILNVKGSVMERELNLYTSTGFGTRPSLESWKENTENNYINKRHQSFWGILSNTELFFTPTTKAIAGVNNTNQTNTTHYGTNLFFGQHPNINTFLTNKSNGGWNFIKRNAAINVPTTFSSSVPILNTKLSNKERAIGGIVSNAVKLGGESFMITSLDLGGQALKHPYKTGAFLGALYFGQTYLANTFGFVGQAGNFVMDTALFGQYAMSQPTTEGKISAIIGGAELGIIIPVAESTITRKDILHANPDVNPTVPTIPQGQMREWFIANEGTIQEFTSGKKFGTLGEPKESLKTRERLTQGAEFSNEEHPVNESYLPKYEPNAPVTEGYGFFYSVPETFNFRSDAEIFLINRATGQRGSLETKKALVFRPKGIEQVYENIATGKLEKNIPLMEDFARQAKQKSKETGMAVAIELTPKKGKLGTNEMETGLFYPNDTKPSAVIPIGISPEKYPLWGRYYSYGEGIKDFPKQVFKLVSSKVNYESNFGEFAGSYVNYKNRLIAKGMLGEPMTNLEKFDLGQYEAEYVGGKHGLPHVTKVDPWTWTHDTGKLPSEKDVYLNTKTPTHGDWFYNAWKTGNANEVRIPNRVGGEKTFGELPFIAQMDYALAEKYHEDYVPFNSYFKKNIYGNTIKPTGRSLMANILGNVFTQIRERPSYDRGTLKDRYDLEVDTKLVNKESIVRFMNEDKPIISRFETRENKNSIKPTKESKPFNSINVENAIGKINKISQTKRRINKNIYQARDLYLSDKKEEGLLKLNRGKNLVGKQARLESGLLEIKEGKFKTKTDKNNFIIGRESQLLKDYFTQTPKELRKPRRIEKGSYNGNPYNSNQKPVETGVGYYSPFTNSKWGGKNNYYSGLQRSGTTLPYYPFNEQNNIREYNNFYTRSPKDYQKYSPVKYQSAKYFGGAYGLQEYSNPSYGGENNNYYATMGATKYEAPTYAPTETPRTGYGTYPNYAPIAYQGYAPYSGTKGDFGRGFKKKMLDFNGDVSPSKKGVPVRARQPKRYNASFVSVAYGLYGSKPKRITGLEFRPILGGKKRKKKRPALDGFSVGTRGKHKLKSSKRRGAFGDIGVGGF